MTKYNFSSTGYGIISLFYFYTEKSKRKSELKKKALHDPAFAGEHQRSFWPLISETALVISLASCKWLHNASPLGMYNQISILMLQAGDELGNKYAGAHKKKSRQSRGASVLARTINLCLFQSQGWPNQCKIPAGMSSISVNLSIPLCVGSGVMDWFCHFCSVHSMLTWKGAGRLRAKVTAVPALTLRGALRWDHGAVSIGVPFWFQEPQLKDHT